MFCSCSVSALHITQASKQACLVVHCCRLFASSSRGFFIRCLHNISLSRLSLCSLYFFLMVFTSISFSWCLLIMFSRCYFSFAAILVSHSYDKGYGSQPILISAVSSHFVCLSISVFTLQTGVGPLLLNTIIAFLCVTSSLCVQCSDPNPK